MFERYSEGARLAIYYARQEAHDRGAGLIRNEHLLLGIVRAEPSTATLLRPAHIEQLRDDTGREPASTTEATAYPDHPLSVETKGALIAAAEEAERRSDSHIGNEHLLLGIVNRSDCYAAQWLSRHGVTADTIREQITAFRETPAAAGHGLDRRWTELGIPEGYGFPKLSFHPPTTTMIVELETRDDTWRPPRLLMKRKDDAKYELVGDPDDMTSHESPALAPTMPLLAYIVMHWREYEHGIGGDWKELRVIDLNTGVLTAAVRHGELSLPAGFENCSIHRLLSLSDDGKVVHVTAGLTGRQSTAVMHVVAVLDLPSKRLNVITTLRGVFF